MAVNNNLTFKAIVATDSRGREFEHFHQQNTIQNQYEVVYIIKRGGKVYNIGEDILAEARNTPTNTVLVVVIGCGINNCTFRLRHSW